MRWRHEVGWLGLTLQDGGWSSGGERSHDHPVHAWTWRGQPKWRDRPEPAQNASFIDLSQL